MCSAGFHHYRHSDKSILSSGNYPGLSFTPRRTPDALKTKTPVQSSGLSLAHRDAIHITTARTQTDGRCVLAILRRYKEQPTSFPMFRYTKENKSVTGHESLHCSNFMYLVPMFLKYLCMNTSNIGKNCSVATVYAYSRVWVFRA
jgi:hypothetical protein